MSPGRAKALNLLLLLFGYGVGQGGLFAAQTLLLGQGNLVLIAEFGKAFYLATLTLMIIDFGAVVYLAREAARTLPGRGELDAAYWQITPVRILAAAVAAAVAGSYASAHLGTFSGNYAAAALPGLLLWSMNFTGVLDGARLSGANGVAGALSFAASAIGLFLAREAPLPVAGAVLGASLTCGCALSMALQFGALLSTGRPIRFQRPTVDEVINTTRASGAALLSFLPGQIYFRFQIFLCATFLSVTATAVFLYGKQIITAFAQVIGFLRRIEFPDLVQRLASPNSRPLSDALLVQAPGTLFSAGSSVVVASLGIFFAVIGDAEAAAAGRATAIFAPIIVCAALALGFTQALIAVGRFRSAATIMTTSAVVASATAYACIDWGISGLALADFVACVVNIALATWVLSKHGRTLSDK